MIPEAHAGVVKQVFGSECHDYFTSSHRNGGANSVGKCAWRFAGERDGYSVGQKEIYPGEQCSQPADQKIFYLSKLSDEAENYFSYLQIPLLWAGSGRDATQITHGIDYQM
tara:strand:+ start:50 stop:382 length:333 start_codon:yes stop_codon:yes gene_type:complete